MNRNKYTVMSIVLLGIMLILSFNIGLAQDETILFEDNFENGARSAWSYWKATHEIIEVDGNHVNHITSGNKDWAGIDVVIPNNSHLHWTNYAIEARIKILSIDLHASTPQIFVNLRKDANEKNRYAGMIWFKDGASSVGLAGTLDGQFVGILPMEQHPINTKVNTWYTVRMQANSNEIAVYIDNQLVTRAIHDDLKEGSPSIELAANVDMYLDDVKVYKLEEQKPSIDNRFADIDCTIPELGKATGVTLNLAAGVNVRSLTTNNFGSVVSIPQVSDVSILGWFDAAGTPFESIASGTWLVLHDGNYAVKASLVSITDAILADLPQYQYKDSAFVAPPKPEVSEDAQNRFVVTYADFCKGTLVWTTQTVQINSDTVMPVPFGLVKTGEYESVDTANRYSGVLSGIFVRSWEEGSQRGRWNLIIAFPTKTGKWSYVYVSANGGFSLHPVDADLQSINPSGEFHLVQPQTRINTNTILAERTIHTGDHVILYFGEYTTTMSGEHNTQKGCSDLATTSDAIAFVIKGGMCKLVSQPAKDGWASTYLRGLMFLND